MSKYYVESSILYRLINGNFNELLERHANKEIELITSSIVLSDQFNNERGWRYHKENILEFTLRHGILIIKAPDIVWYTENESKDLPGPFVIGESQIASDIWGGDDSKGIRDIIGRIMFSNYEDLKRRSSETELNRKNWFNCLFDIYHVISAIDNGANYILTRDNDILRAKEFILAEYGIEVVTYN